MIPLRLVLAAIVSSFASACASEGVVAPRILTVTSELRNAPEVVSLEGVAVHLETYLWRDFQPISPPDGKPLLALVRIKGAGGTVLPATLKADSVWIVNGELAWVASLREEQPRGPDLSFFEAMARDGPKWGPGITVDVVVRLRNVSGQRVLVRVGGQMVHRTD